MLAARGGLLLVGAIGGVLLLGLAGSERVAWGEESRTQTRDFRLYDGFDGKLALDWEVIRSNPETVSLAKNPGKLTITSERGGLHEGDRGRDSGKNVHLIANPAKGDGDFVVTTCLELFHPQAPYQQAGPLVYDDDNHYFKTVIACNDTGVLLGASWEFNGAFDGQNYYIPNLKWDRLWLRLTKRGTVYESAYSTDGKTYTVVGEHAWGNAAPKKVGLAVMNENGTSDGLDAAFDFFEVRSLTAEEKRDPAYQERQKLQGMWEVLSTHSNGGPMPKEPLSRFEFRGISLIITERGNSLTSQYTLAPAKQPKEMTITKPSSEATTAIYQLNGDDLAVCMNPLPGAPAPTELKTKEGDGRLLVTLKRMPAAKAAAIARNAIPPRPYFLRLYFLRLDTNRDQVLTKEELLADYPSAEAAKQGSEIFDLLDANHDGKLSLEEFNKRPSKALYLQMDLDANGSLSVDELHNSEMRGASEEQAQQVFAFLDGNGDRRLTFEEYSKRRRQGQAIGAAAGPVVQLLPPAVRPAKEATPDAKSTTNLKRIGLAMHNHEAVFRAFPAGYSADKDGKPLLSWRVHLLPFLENVDLYNQFHLDEPWDSPHNKKLVEKMPDVYRSPGSKSKPDMTNYLGVGGADGVFVRPRPGDPPDNKLGTRMHRITDGTSNTIMIVEVADESAVIWTKPGDFSPKKDKPLQGLLGLRPGGFLAGFADGSVRLIPETVEPGMLKALFTKSGGEVVRLPR